ncbi:putative reverse transcriptase domain-containing protein, partial [Tanacetum coccineum]
SIPTEIPIVSPNIPPSPDYTPASLNYSPTSDTETDPSEDLSSDHIPPLLATSPFLSPTDDSSDSDTPDTPPSPTHGTSFTDIALSTQSSPAASGALRRRSSSSKTLSDSPSDDLSDSSSSHSSSDHSLPALPSGTRSSYHLCSLVPSIPRSSAAAERPSHSSVAGPSHKRSRSPTIPISIPLHIPGAFSSARADLLPPPKRIRSFDFVIDLEGCLDKSSESSVPRETSLRDDVVVKGSDEPHLEHDINLEIQAEINECIAYADALRARGIDARVVVEAIDREEIETGTRGLVKVRVETVMNPTVPDDIPKPAQEEGAVKVTYETLGDLVQRFHDHTEEILVCRRISELERDNMRLRGTLDVTSQRVSPLQRRKTMPNTRSGATMIHEAVNELIECRVTEALDAHDAARNLEPLMESGGEQGDKNGDNYEGGNGGVNGNGGNGNSGGNGNGNDNGNGNGNGGGNGHNFGGLMPVARECTYQDFLKCQPLNFNGTEGVKMETELWNLTVKGNDLTAYTRRFQELVLLCTRMAPDEEYKVERFIGGLPNNIQGNVIAAEPTRLQDAIRVANMDKKLKGYARNAKNKRRFDNNLRYNRGQQPAFKRQNVGGQNVARAYTAGSNEKRGYVESVPYCNKCRLHHEGSCTVRCGNCKRVSHMTRDCTTAVVPNTQRTLVGNQPGIVCYECGRPRHFKKDCPKLRNQNHGNKNGNKTRNKTGNKIGSNEATTKAYAIGGGANPDSNVITGTFLLNNCYASMLFDSGTDRSFVSSTFSALLDVAPSTLDTSYAVELADGRISEKNVILRGRTLGLLGHPFDIDLMPVELGSFDVIIDMDWLVKYHAVIVCNEKIVSQFISKKAKDKLEEKRLEDVPIVQEILEVFPEDLPGLPPA